jgi:sporulation protein YtfJ
MEPKDLLTNMVEEMRQVAKTETVIGDPIEVAGNTIIPVSRVSLGFGGGTGHGEGDDTTKHSKGLGEGGGGAGGIRIEPAAFIVVKEGKVEVVGVPNKRTSLDELIDRAPEFMERVMKARGEARPTSA